MRKILVLVFVILGVLFLGFFSTAFGEMMMSTVGVAKGDVFRYGYTCYFNSNNINAVPPASFSSINQTDYFMVSVTRVSGSSVDFDTTLRGLNGSSSLGVCSMNVGTGMVSVSGYAGPGEETNFYFMASNVGMMGRMFPSSDSSPTINDTLMMSYAGGQRLTDHFATTTVMTGMTVNSDFYFDQATGTMVEWRQQTIQTSSSQFTNSTQMMKITSSSIWTVPEFPTFLVPAFAIMLISTLAVSAIIKLKRNHPAQMVPLTDQCFVKAIFSLVFLSCSCMSSIFHHEHKPCLRSLGTYAVLPGFLGIHPPL
jgi:hypothetical protein